MAEQHEQQAYPHLPAELANHDGQIRAFNKWSYEDITVTDVSLAVK